MSTKFYPSEYYLKIDFCGLISNQGPNMNSSDPEVQKSCKKFGKPYEDISQLSSRKLFFKID